MPRRREHIWPEKRNPARRRPRRRYGIAEELCSLKTSPMTSKMTYGGSCEQKREYFDRLIALAETGDADSEDCGILNSTKSVEPECTILAPEWLCNDDISVSTLFYRLETALQVLKKHANLSIQNQNSDVHLQLSSSEVQDLVTTLAVDRFIGHCTASVRLLTACVLAELLRISAPDLPLSTDKLLPLAALFADQLALLAVRNSPWEQYRFALLEQLALVKTLVIFCDDSDVVSEFFACSYSLVRPHHSQKLNSYLSDILFSLLEEAETTSQKVLDAVIAPFLYPSLYTCAAGQLCESVLARVKDIVQVPLCQFVQSSINKVHARNGAEVPPGEKYTEISEARCLLTRSCPSEPNIENMLIRVHRIAPEILMYVVPQLERDLHSKHALHRWHCACLLAALFTASFDMARTYPSLLADFIDRFRDADPCVRIELCNVSIRLLESNPDLRDELGMRLGERLHDKDEKVRISAVRAACNSFRFLDERVLRLLAGRVKDRKTSVRRESLHALVAIYRASLNAVNVTQNIPPSSREDISSTNLDSLPGETGETRTENLAAAVPATDDMRANVSNFSEDAEQRYSWIPCALIDAYTTLRKFEDYETCRQIEFAMFERIYDWPECKHHSYALRQTAEEVAMSGRYWDDQNTSDISSKQWDQRQCLWDSPKIKFEGKPFDESGMAQPGMADDCTQAESSILRGSKSPENLKTKVAFLRARTEGNRIRDPVHSRVNAFLQYLGDLDVRGYETFYGIVKQKYCVHRLIRQIASLRLKCKEQNSATRSLSNTGTAADVAPLRELRVCNSSRSQLCGEPCHVDRSSSHRATSRTAHGHKVNDAGNIDHHIVGPRPGCTKDGEKGKNEKSRRKTTISTSNPPTNAAPALMLVTERLSRVYADVRFGSEGVRTLLDSFARTLDLNVFKELVNVLDLQRSPIDIAKACKSIISRVGSKTNLSQFLSEIIFPTCSGSVFTACHVNALLGLCSCLASEEDNFVSNEAYLSVSYPDPCSMNNRFDFLRRGCLRYLRLIADFWTDAVDSAAVATLTDVISGYGSENCHRGGPSCERSLARLQASEESHFYQSLITAQLQVLCNLNSRNLEKQAAALSDTLRKFTNARAHNPWHTADHAKWATRLLFSFEQTEEKDEKERMVMNFVHCLDAFHGNLDEIIAPVTALIQVAKHHQDVYQKVALQVFDFAFALLGGSMQPKVLQAMRDDLNNLDDGAAALRTNSESPRIPFARNNVTVSLLRRLIFPVLKVAAQQLMKLLVLSLGFIDSNNDELPAVLQLLVSVSSGKHLNLFGLSPTAPLPDRPECASCDSSALSLTSLTGDLFISTLTDEDASVIHEAMVSVTGSYRLSAGSEILKIARDPRFYNRLSPANYLAVALCSQDEHPDVRLLFARKVHKSILQKRLPFRWVACFSLMAVDPDKQNQSEVKAMLNSLIRHRRKCFDVFSSKSESAKSSALKLLPEAVLPELIWVIANHPDAELDATNGFAESERYLEYFFDRLLEVSDFAAVLHEYLTVISVAADAAENHNALSQGPVSRRISAVARIGIALLKKKMAGKKWRLEMPIHASLPADLYSMSNVKSDARGIKSKSLVDVARKHDKDASRILSSAKKRRRESPGTPRYNLNISPTILSAEKEWSSSKSRKHQEPAQLLPEFDHEVNAFATSPMYQLPRCRNESHAPSQDGEDSRVPDPGSKSSSTKATKPMDVLSPLHSLSRIRSMHSTRGSSADNLASGMHTSKTPNDKSELQIGERELRRSKRLKSTK